MRKRNAALIAGAVVAATAALIVPAAVSDRPTPAASPSAPAPTSPAAQPVLVGPGCTLPTDVPETRDTDGDTIHVQLCGADVTVRIIGINTPETHKPRTPVQCYGPEASAFARKTLNHQTVHLVADRKAGLRDRYGRLLAFVEVGGQDYGLLAIQAGLAEANDYGHRQSRTAAYAKAAAAAKAAKAGAWGACPDPFKK